MRVTGSGDPSRDGYGHEAVQTDCKQLEQRLRRGMRMLARGVAQAEVARACGVSRQTASSWARLQAQGPQAWRRRRLGRPGAMIGAERAKVSKMLIAGAVANGFATELWTLARIAKLIKRKFGHAFSTVHVWCMLGELHNHSRGDEP